jgi:hypothetical protein
MPPPGGGQRLDGRASGGIVRNHYVEVDNRLGVKAGDGSAARACRTRVSARPRAGVEHEPGQKWAVPARRARGGAWRARSLNCSAVSGYAAMAAASRAVS